MAGCNNDDYERDRRLVLGGTWTACASVGCGGHLGLHHGDVHRTLFDGRFQSNGPQVGPLLGCANGQADGGGWRRGGGGFTENSSGGCRWRIALRSNVCGSFEHREKSRTVFVWPLGTIQRIAVFRVRAGGLPSVE